MLCSFFPAHCSHILEPFLPRTLNFFYPQDVVEACPEQSVSNVLGVDIITIRRPFLAMFAVLGITIGFVGAYRLQFTFPSDISSPNEHSTCQSRFYWTIAFLSFGLMNFSVLFLHCLLSFPEETGKSPLERQLSWVGDTFTTGVFGSALWAASMLESVPTDVKRIGEWNTVKLIQYGWLVGNFYGLFAVAFFLVLGYNPDSLVPGTLPLELFYSLPPTLFASTGLILMLLRNFSWQLLFFFSLSYVVFLVALFDSWFCRRFGNTFLDLFTTPTLFFAATDLVYIGIWFWLERKYHQSPEKLKNI